MLRLENRLSWRFLRTMVSMSWCKYIQRDLFLLNNPRFSFWSADMFTYSIWKAACPLLSSEPDRIIENLKNSARSCCFSREFLFYLLCLRRKRDNSVSLVLFKTQTKFNSTGSLAGDTLSFPFSAFQETRLGFGSPLKGERNTWGVTTRLHGYEIRGANHQLVYCL